MTGEVLEFSEYHMLNICRFIIAGRGKCFLNVFVRITNDLSKVFEWSLAYYLKSNPSKSMVLLIYRNHL
jgi:hypothetical protein